MIVTKEHKPIAAWIQGYYELEKEREENHL